MRRFKLRTLNVFRKFITRIMGYVEEDYLMRYFNQLGIVLSKILGLKKEGQFDEALEIIDKALADFGLENTDYYLSLDIQDLENKRKNLQVLNNIQIKILADLLLEKGEIEIDQGNHESGRNCYTRVLLLLNYLTEVEKTFSFEREEKISKIKKILDA